MMMMMMMMVMVVMMPCLVLLLLPPPHVAEQAVQAPHSPTRQATEFSSDYLFQIQIYEMKYAQNWHTTVRL